MKLHASVLVIPEQNPSHQMHVHNVSVPVAQSVDRGACNSEVMGSIPRTD